MSTERLLFVIHIDLAVISAIKLIDVASNGSKKNEEIKFSDLELIFKNLKSLFERRLEMKIDASNGMMMESFLNMYANPVVNKLKYGNAI